MRSSEDELGAHARGAFYNAPEEQLEADELIGSDVSAAELTPAMQDIIVLMKDPKTLCHALKRWYERKFAVTHLPLKIIAASLAELEPVEDAGDMFSRSAFGCLTHWFSFLEDGLYDRFERQPKDALAIAHAWLNIIDHASKDARPAVCERIIACFHGHPMPDDDVLIARLGKMLHAYMQAWLNSHSVEQEEEFELCIGNYFDDVIKRKALAKAFMLLSAPMRQALIDFFSDDGCSAPEVLLGFKGWQVQAENEMAAADCGAASAVVVAPRPMVVVGAAAGGGGAECAAAPAVVTARASGSASGYVKRSSRRLTRTRQRQWLCSSRSKASWSPSVVHKVPKCMQDTLVNRFRKLGRHPCLFTVRHNGTVQRGVSFIKSHVASRLVVILR
jgi:hypothetical protein